MKLTTIGLVFLAMVPCVQLLGGPQEDQGREVYRRGLFLQSRMTVLSISLQPGFEDLAALSYLRFGRGAKIVNAFVTNGESGDNAAEAETPGEVAFHKRAEAYQVSLALYGTEYFMNFPDFGSAGDTARVKENWGDSLETKILDLIEFVRPDLIILAPDRQETGSVSPRWEVLRMTLGRAVRTAAQKKTESGFLRPRSWKVGRVAIASPSGTITFPLDRKPEFDTRTVGAIGSELALMYRSMSGILPLWQSSVLHYSIDFPSESKSPKSPDAGIPGRLPPGVQNLGKQVDGLWSYLLPMVKKGTLSRSKSTALRRLVTIMDSIDVRLSGWNFFANEDRKILLHWKDGLEELRNAIVGVSVRYTMKDTVLLARQLTTIRIDSVFGLPSGGTTQVFFPDVGPRWFLNEGVEPRMPLVIGSDYRLISPSPVDLDLPMSYGGRLRPQHGSPFEFFILHQKKSRVESFFKKTSQRILFAPKLTVEPLTPIVRVIPHERFVYRITNHSNDGILDRLGIQDTLARAEPRTFRLNVKESSVVDTLELIWRDPMPEGTYRIRLEISGAAVGYLAARKFDAAIDSTRTVGILPSGKNSVVLQTLRRLGVRYKILDVGGIATSGIDRMNIVVLDERLLSLQSQAVDSHVSFGEFVQKGGTLLVLSQDEDVWNKAKIIDGVTLRGTSSLDGETIVVVDTLHPVGLTPNRLTDLDWEGWLFSRAQNHITNITPGTLTTPIMLGEQDKTPGIVVIPKGKGKLVYVNLNLGKQLENIHPGAFRVLANLLAF